MPLDYRHVKDMYDDLAAQGAVSEPLEDWSAKMNAATGTENYSEGMHDPLWIKRGSVAIDRFLESTGLPAVTGAIGRSAGEVLGIPEMGERIGQKVPRGIFDIAPYFIPGVGLIAGGAASGALAGAGAYTETGSPAAGVIGGLTSAAMPGVGGLVRQAALKRAGAELVEGPLLKEAADVGVDRLQQLASGAVPTAVKEYIPTTFGQAAAGFGAEQAAMSGLGAVGSAAQSLYSGEPFHWDPREELLNIGLNAAPLTGVSLARHGAVGFGGEAARRHIEETKTSIELTRNARDEKTRLDEIREKTAVEDIPDVAEVGIEFADRNSKINELRAKQRMASEDGTTFSEEERQKMLAEEDALVKAQGQRRGYIFGAQIDVNTPRRTVYGSEVVFDPETGFRRILASEDPRNAELAGKQIGYDTAHEPPVTAGEYNVPVGYHSEFLPNAEGGFDREAKLNIAQQKLAAAKSNADLQDAVVELNGVRKSYGMAPVDDAHLAKSQQDFGLGGVRDAVHSELERTRNLSQAKDIGRELTRLEAEGQVRETELQAAKEAGDQAAAALAQTRLNEINARHAEIHPVREGAALDRERTREVANAPRTRENAPAKDKMHENAVAITEGTEHKESQSRFLAWAQEGRTGLKRLGMDETAMAKFINQPEVQEWQGQLELSMAGGVPLQEYGERYLKNLGLSADQAKGQTARAIGLSDKGELFTDELLKSPAVDPLVKKTGVEMQAKLAADPEMTSDTQGVLKDLGHSNVDELYDAMLRTGKFDKTALDLLPSPVADYLAAKARDHENTLNVLDGATLKDTQGVARPPTDVADPVGNTLGSVHKLLEISAEGRSKAAAEADGLSAVAPKNFMLRTINGLLSDPMALLGDKWQNAKNYLKTLNYQIGASPEMAEYGVRAHQLEPNTKKMETEAQKVFMLDNEGKKTDRYLKALRDPSTVAALDKWVGYNMQRGQETGAITMRSPDDPGVTRILRGLSDEKRQNVIDMMNKIVHSRTMENAQIIEKMQSIAVTEGADMLSPVMGLKSNQNIQLSEAIMRGLRNPADVEAQRLSEIAITKIGQRDLDVPYQLRDFLLEKSAAIDAQAKHFEENPAQVTANLYGKWDVTYKKGGREFFTRVDSKRAAEGLGEILDIRRNETDDDTPVSYEPAGRREDVKWLENHLASTKRNAAYWSRALYKAQTKFLLGGTELSDRPDLQRMVKEHQANMLTPDPEVGRTMTKFVSTWFLGGNIASAMANGTQMLTRGAAELTKLNGSTLKSYKSVLDAVKEVTEASIDKSKWRGEHKWLMDKYEAEKTGSAYDVMGEKNDDIALQLKWALNHGRPRSIGEQSSGLINKASNVAMLLFRGVENMNTKSAMIAAFDHYRQQKLPDGRQVSREEAYQRASEFNQSVNDVGGKANRPIMLYSSMPKSAAMIMSSMQSFNIGTVGQIVNLVKQGWGAAGKTPAERYNAKKATVQLAAVQFGLAGVMGIPFAATGLALLNQFFPQWELNKNLRLLTQQLWGEDDDHDHVLSDISMNGMPSMLGWDFQSRLSMGNTVPGVSEINGYQPDILAGPAYSILSKFVDGGKKVMSGDISGLKSMIPPAIEKIRAATFADGKVVDYNGKPIAGGDRTWGELTGQVIGFQPTRLTQINKLNRIRVQSENEHRNQDKQFNQDLGQDLLDGKIGSAIQKLKDKASADPEYDIRAGGRKAVDAASEMYFPRDLRRQLSRNDAKIAQLLPVYKGAVTEEERADFKRTLLQRIGVPVRKKDEVYYQMLSAVEAENPTATRAQIQQEAQRRLGKIKKAHQELLPTAEGGELSLNF